MAVAMSMKRMGPQIEPSGLTAEELDQFCGKALVVPYHALPKDENVPAECMKAFEVPTVTGQGALKLLPPERHVLPGHGTSAAPPMSVPEASMNQNDLLSAGKDEIGLAWKVGPVKPVSVAQPGQDAAYQLLWRGIARLDLLHSAGGTFVRGVDSAGRHDRILLPWFFTSHRADRTNAPSAWRSLRALPVVGDQS